MNSEKVAKVYKPVGLVLSTASGVVAGKAVRKTWQRVGSRGGAASPTDEERALREIVAAAAVQGAVTAVVKAAVNRAGATTTRRLTGTWPG
ncbi:DUF4235 domain-containing protein [Streptomyces sp. NPDC050560]|uniref:DUF4235 domain-containing protein n=1 Tax=Streptomyces sp. NPDC050560 TaxID=3365630 RepID=UPI003790C7C1